MVERRVMWQPWSGPGLESLRIVEDADGVRAEAVVIGVDEGRSFAVRYAIRCDAAWHVRDVEIASLEGRSTTLALASNGMGRWTDGSGEHVPSLDGCLDVDLSATPFTNTLPIRRLSLAPGWATEITVVYIAVPALTVGVSRQRYRCLTWGAGGGAYRFETGAGDFTADITVDADGLVVEYPQIARRVWSA
jgi:uncharacterized protein